MDEFLPALQRCSLFTGMEPAEIHTLLNCLNSKQQRYAKGETVLRQGDRIEAFGLVLQGSVHVVQEDFWGNQNLIADIGSGEVFGESYAFSSGAVLSVTVVAQEDTVLLMVDARRALSICSNTCGFHHTLIRRLVSMLAAKNLRLNEKLQYVTQRTTREKLLSFLSAQSNRKGCNPFEIPFNRQQLADYLSVDRSAMSNELCKLRDEGVLRFQRNQFELLDRE
ncbi:MAG TPA: Crp/Fnr family transcriptional regulator [Candidatus Limiplasma sp.]|nr:Crp/Fnr family transcriptional regulator [Candidatus Limiplasma sp.]HPS81482.1 Crp/Fnr family transcriptional regulator [Candidatus Limiplasma sp.]